MKKTLLLLLTGLVVLLVNAQEQTPVPLKHGAHRIGKRNDAAMNHWRDYGLGQFIHWGIYAIPGGYWEGQKTTAATEWIRSWRVQDENGKRVSPKFGDKTFTEIYDNLYKEFNPKDFDAKAWAKMAKQMGTKYMIFTTKHHDGFCMWPSKYTDYTIANTPYKKDLMKELVDAYNAEGIDVVFYFSIIDWNHLDYQGVTPKTDEDKARYENFKQFTRNQLIELITNYPTVKGLWFDGTWDSAWINEAKWADELEQELFKISPDLIIGSRFRADELGKRHMDYNGNIIGDYYQYWERKLPTTYDMVKNYDWECVMTILPNNWGYAKDWSSYYMKTADDLIEMIVRTKAYDGNFVLNFGPDGNGDFRPEEKMLSSQIGEWMKINGEAIHGTRHIDLNNRGWGYYTAKDNKVYMIVFNRPFNNKLRVEVPQNMDLKPLKAYFLENGKEVTFERVAIGLDRDKDNPTNNYNYYDVTIPAKYKADKPFTIVLETEQATVKADDTIQKAWQ